MTRRGAGSTSRGERPAADFGRELAGDHGGRTEDIVDQLARRGFEPYDDAGTIRLRNCPFHQLAQEHTGLVCGMNLAMLRGVVEASGAPVEARLEPAPDPCCVAFDPIG